MDSITSFSRDNCERDIRLSKKWFRYQICWVVFNLSVTCFDFHTLINDPNAWSGASFGAMVVTSFWSILFLLESWFELRIEKARLKFLTELSETQLASNERKQYVEATKYYTQLIESLQKNKDMKDDKGI